LNLLAATEAAAGLDPVWVKGGVLLFFLLFFLGVLVRVITTRRETDDRHAQIPLTDDVVEPRVQKKPARESS
jgi:cbb3-type cytochrome oxidase subunit 3